MKKVLSLLLATILLFSCASTAFAASGCSCDVSPVIYIRGFGETLYLHPGAENEEEALNFSTGAIASCIPDLLIALTAKSKGNSDSAIAHLEKVADKLVGKIACDKNGNSLYDVSIEKRDLPTDDNHQTLSYGFAKRIEGLDDAEYDFHYDWRLDPIENTRYLKEFVEYIKELTGHDKVTLVAHSQGNTLVATYLEEYGSNDIDKILFLSPAYQGVGVASALFAGEANVSDKGDELIVLLDNLVGEQVYGKMVSVLMQALVEKGLVDTILDDAQTLLDNDFKKIYAEYVLDLLGTMPGFWSFCDEARYETALEFSFGDTEGYDVLVSKIKYYHENVQRKLTDLIDDAIANGVEIAIGCGYGRTSIPIGDSEVCHCDTTIETKYMSIGATCAPLGETLSEDYINSLATTDYLSPDLEIDASTCAYPEYTWFVKNQEHSTYYDSYREWMIWVLTFDGQPTVHSDANYPQFKEYEDGDIIPVEEPENRTEQTLLQKFLEALFEIIFALFGGLF